MSKVFEELLLTLARSEEHTSEFQSPCNLVCRLLLEKKKILLAQHELQSPGDELSHSRAAEAELAVQPHLINAERRQWPVNMDALHVCVSALSRAYQAADSVQVAEGEMQPQLQSHLKLVADNYGEPIAELFDVRPLLMRRKALTEFTQPQKAIATFPPTPHKLVQPLR